jgi:excisionase family DNA binding protein
MASSVIIDISQKRWMSEDEACTYTSLSRRTLFEARELRHIPYRLLGRKVVYDRIDLDTYMERLELHKDGRIRRALNKSLR